MLILILLIWTNCVNLIAFCCVYYRQLDFSVVEFYEHFNTFPLLKLYKEQIRIFVHKFMYRRYMYKLSPVFNDYFLRKNLIHDHNTRLDQHLHFRSISTSVGHRSIKFHGSLLLNQLPLPRYLICPSILI